MLTRVSAKALRATRCSGLRQCRVLANTRCFSDESGDIKPPRDPRSLPEGFFRLWHNNLQVDELMQEVAERENMEALPLLEKSGISLGDIEVGAAMAYQHIADLFSEEDPAFLDRDDILNPDMALMLNGVEYELDSRGMRPHVDVTGDVKVTILGVGYGAYTSTLLLDVVAAWYGKPAPRRDPQHTEMDQYQMFGIGVLGNLVTTHNYYMNLAADKHFHRGLVEERGSEATFWEPGLCVDIWCKIEAKGTFSATSQDEPENDFSFPLQPQMWCFKSPFAKPAEDKLQDSLGFVPHRNFTEAIQELSLPEDPTFVVGNIACTFPATSTLGRHPLQFFQAL